MSCYELPRHHVAVVSFKTFEDIGGSSTPLATLYCTHHAPSLGTLISDLPGTSLLVEAAKRALDCHPYTLLF
eukprot:IDg23251t1